MDEQKGRNSQNTQVKRIILGICLTVYQDNKVMVIKNCNINPWTNRTEQKTKKQTHKYKEN